MRGPWEEEAATCSDKKKRSKHQPYLRGTDSPKERSELPLSTAKGGDDHHVTKRESGKDEHPAGGRLRIGRGDLGDLGGNKK